MTEVLNGYEVHNSAKGKTTLACKDIYGCNAFAENVTSITDITTIKLDTVQAVALSE